MKLCQPSLLAAFALAACAPPAGDARASWEPAPPDQANAVKYRVETVAENLRVPWSIVFPPDGRIIFSERPGRVRVIASGKLVEQPLHTLTDIAVADETGLMGMTLHPDFAKNRWLYLAYATSRSSVRVMRFRETGSALVEGKIIIDNLPAATNHAGCRLKFGPDGKLYVTVGDATDRRIAQQMDSLGGKTLRLNADGSVPQDNPFVGREGVRPEIWSYGHRNAQGMDWQPGTGLMFQTEHGPSGFDGPGGGDEVNVVEKGRNYGWPVVSHTRSWTGMVSPLLEFTPAVVPASGMFYRGDALPQFKGNFLFGCLRGNAIMRVVLDGRKVISHERLFTSYGRIREVAEGPDGTIYFSTSNRDGRGSPAATDDRILRIVPQKP